MKNGKSTVENYPVKHIPEYKDQDELNLVLNKLKNFPPLVFVGNKTFKRSTCKCS